MNEFDNLPQNSPSLGYCNDMNSFNNINSTMLSNKNDLEDYYDNFYN